MRILVVTPFPPDPAGRHGGSVYLGTYLQELARHAEVALVSLASRSEREEAALPDGLARVHLVPHTPLRELRGAGRWAHRTRMLADWGARGRPLLAAKHFSRSLARQLARTCEDFDPQVVLVEMAVMAQYLPLFAGRPTVLTDHERGEALPAEIGPRGLGASRDARLWARYVRRYYRRATVVQTLTPEDAAELGAVLGRTVEVRRPAVPLPPDVVDPARSGPRALFLGNYLHAPNVQAAAHLASEVWPRVRERHGDAELWLAGAHLPAALRELRERPGVSVVGAVDDLGQLFGSVRLLLAPLFSGGGTRIKVPTAMAHGLPVVANRLGLQGLDAPAEAVRRAESDAELAAAVLDLLEHPGHAAAAGRAARRWVEEELSPAALVREQLARLRALLPS